MISIHNEVKVTIVKSAAFDILYYIYDVYA